MDNTILCIEFGNHITHMAEVADHNKTIEIIKTHSFATPDDHVRDGKVRVSSEMISTLRDQIAISGIDTDKIAFAITSTKILYKSVVIPTNDTNKDIQSTINAMFSDLFPVAPELYSIHFSIQKECQDKLILDVFAVPNGYIGPDGVGMNDPFDRIAVALGMKCVGVVDSSFGVLQTFANDFKYINSILINLQDEMTDISLIEDGKLKSKSTVWCGVGRIADIVHRHAPIYLDDCFDAARMMTMVDMLKSPIDENDQSEKLQIAIKREVENLFKTISSKAIHMLKMDNMKIQTIYVSGMGADWAWLTQAMSQYFQISVKAIAPEHNVLFKSNDAIFQNAYATCACAASQTVNFLNTANKSKFQDLVDSFISIFFNKK